MKINKLRNIKYIFLSIATILAFLVFWQLIVSWGIVSQRAVASPTQVFNTFIEKLTGSVVPDGQTLLQNIGTSLEIAMYGFLLGVVIGIPLGLLMGWYKVFKGLVRPIFEILRPIPAIAWIPFTIIWFGIGFEAKVFIIFFSSLIPCVVNSYSGILMTNVDYVNVAKTCGASNFQAFTRVGFQASLPYVFAGMRIGLGSAWATLVAAEMLAANSGLGYMIVMGRQFARPDIIILGMVTIGAIGLIITKLFEMLEKKILGRRYINAES